MTTPFRDLLLKIRYLACEAKKSDQGSASAAEIVSLIDEQFQNEQPVGAEGEGSLGPLIMFADEPSLLRLDGQFFSVETIRESLKTAGHGVTTDSLGIHWLAHDMVKGLVDLAQSLRKQDSVVDEHTILLLAAAERITRLERVTSKRSRIS